MMMERLIALLFLSSSLLNSIPNICHTDAADIINSTQSIQDGDTIVSSGGTFVLGFFSPGSSKNRYVGIWYNHIPAAAKTVVWVANRESPLLTSGGRLVVVSPGILVLLNDANTTIWSTSNTTSASTSPVLINPTAQLLESGNLVVRDEAENFLWQSFDYPTDTLLADMKLGKDFVTGLERYLSSWKSDNDPAPGDYTFHCDPTGYPQNTIKKGAVIVFRSGPWTGHGFSGSRFTQNADFTLNLVFNEKEVYFGYKMNNPVLSRLMLNQSGFVVRSTWMDLKKEWLSAFALPRDECDHHSRCGAYGKCNNIIENIPECGCLDEFVPKYPNEWSMSNWSNGCVRKTQLVCKSDVFLNISGVKLPDTEYSRFRKNTSLEECRNECLKNCSCEAYANLDTSDGTGCLHWLKDLFDIKQTPQGGQDIFVRMAMGSSNSDVSGVMQSSGADGKRKNGNVVKVVILLLVAIVLAGFLTIMGLYVWRRDKTLRQLQEQEEQLQWRTEQSSTINESQNQDLELPVFGLSPLANATDNFSIKNKLGEGGFGPVYKGILEDGQEIAVKRLSKASMQGLDEFKNEVICISKLQHRNLVKLLGCCIQGGEKMLVYEYMPNKSLDYYIFDEKLDKVLDWTKRFNIINGIARGLLYLHQDSRLRIIHRDLKASNILLDFDMNPKISDFGIARSFGGNETEASTDRVVGTYGYMSPEYAVEGLFSVKSDVYSFGVLVLEIVSGKKNRGFIHHDHKHNLLGHAWILHEEGRPLELIDDALTETCYLSEVLQSIHVALLCVQQSPEDRPSMSSVVHMLSSEGGLPQPKQPGFFTERSIFGSDFSSSTKPQSSRNETTFTVLEPR